MAGVLGSRRVAAAPTCASSKCPRPAVARRSFERADLVLRRLEAYRRKHGFKDLPVAVVKVPIDIMLPASVVTLEATIKAVEKRFGLPLG